MKKLLKTKEADKKAFAHEKLFMKNWYNYSKKCLNDNLNKEDVSPSFSEDFANLHYKETYEKPHKTVLKDLQWFPDLFGESPGSASFVDFDMYGFRPRDVRKALHEEPIQLFEEVFER